MSPMDDQRTRGKPVLAQLLALWDEHASRYNGVLYRAALVKNGEAWQSAVVLALSRDKRMMRRMTIIAPTMATC